MLRPETEALITLLHITISLLRPTQVSFYREQAITILILSTAGIIKNGSNVN